MRLGQILHLFEPIFRRIDRDRVTNPVDQTILLAHYTSFQALDAILSGSELWFSHPFMLNDYEEMQFGLSEGARLFNRLDMSALPSGRRRALRRAFEEHMQHIAAKEVFDVYVACFAEHAADDNDGVLSMWRGYGHEGDGAALVLDLSRLPQPNGVPITLARVRYASGEERAAEIGTHLDAWLDTVVAADLPDEAIDAAVAIAIKIVLALAITSKHSGFSHEREWRLIYIASRDANAVLARYLSYRIGRRGIEPVLKLKVEAIPGAIGEVSLPGLIDRIIIGPTVASPLTRRGLVRMVERIGHPELAERIVASHIPFRAL